MNEVILYSTGCPNCRTLKLLLEKHNVTYVESKSVDEVIALGFTRVPVLKVNDKYMEYSEAKDWIEKNGGNAE